MLHRSPILRRILAGWLLALFAFGITPKQVLHDWVANHKDTRTHSTDKIARLQTTSYNCHADDLVVESPFTEHDLQTAITASPSFYQYFVDRTNDFRSITHFFFELRGPPALG